MSATPVTTWAGGICGVPKALFNTDRTTAIFTKLVMSNRTKGSKESAAITTSITSGREARPASLATAVPNSIAFTALTSR
jgi:hypothetical protein